MKMENKKALKRKRTPNFSAEEKLSLVRLLSERGQSIISKVTAHDTTTNKEKEEAWVKITNIHNSAGVFVRTADTLKKQWSKLKSEAKIYKAANRRSINGTGGGPPKKFDDPVLELVVDITGRASTGIIDIDDCDADANEDISMTENDPFAGASTSYEYLDDSLFIEDFPEDKTTAIINLEEEPDVQVIEGKKTAHVQEEVQKEVKEIQVKEVQKTAAQVQNEPESCLKKQWVNRRRPEINTTCNERSAKMKTQQRISNTFAAERLRAEQEKTKLILQQLKQNAELHKSKLENEKLKKDLLQVLLKKVQDADSKDVAEAVLKS